MAVGGRIFHWGAAHIKEVGEMQHRPHGWHHRLSSKYGIVGTGKPKRKLCAPKSTTV